MTPGLPTMPAVKLGLAARESMRSGLSAMACKVAIQWD